MDYSSIQCGLVLAIVAISFSTGHSAGPVGMQLTHSSKDDKISLDTPLLHQGGCSPNRTAADYDLVSQQLAVALSNTPPLLPAFVRAAFHDCITATPDKPNSGCNGSLRLQQELGNPNNGRLGNAINVIVQTVAGTCVSVADGIQLANAAALQAAGGPDITADVVDSTNPRVDAQSPDTVPGELPDSNHNFDQSLQFYRRNGFTLRDLVASKSGGHSLGRFAQNNQLLPFTTNPQTILSDYAHNLVQKRSSGTNLPGFNTLSSDDALNSNRGSRRRLDSYAGCQTTGGTCNPDPLVGLQNLNVDFRIFLIKMSRLTDITVGDDSALSQGL